MQKILLIVKRELTSFFSTWMGFIILAASLFIDGLLFNGFAVGSNPKYSAEVLAHFFYYSSGVSMVAGIFLAMKLLAEEKQSGTIVLYYTSPISERSLVYGKFFAALAFSLLLHVVSLYLPALIFIHGKISIGHIAAGYLCNILIGGATIAVTLFASALAPNQLLAAVIGGMITVGFLVLWLVADVVNEPFRELLNFLAIHSKHFESFSRGILNLSDIVYYITFTVFFLECAIRVIESRRLRGEA